MDKKLDDGHLWSRSYVCKEPLLKVAGVTTKCYIPKKSTKTIQKNSSAKLYTVKLVCILFTEVGG